MKTLVKKKINQFFSIIKKVLSIKEDHKKWAGFLFLSIVLIAVIFCVKSANANPVGDAGESIGSWFTSAIVGMSEFFIKMAIFFLGYFITLAQFNDYLNVNTVMLGWTMVRDVANMFFVVILLVIAFGTILGIEQYQWNKTLIKLILAAVFINFSNLICGIFIDAAHVFTITFVNAVSATAGGNFIQAFKLQEIFEISTGGKIDATTKFDIRLFVAAIASLLFAIMAMVAIAVYAIIMLARMIALWVLVILSPLAFIFQVLPGTQSYAKQWWDKFMKQVMVAPIMVFFLWLTFATVGTGGVADDLGVVPVQESGAELNKIGGKGGTSEATLSKATTWANMASFFIPLALMMVGMSVVQQTGVVGSGLVQSGQAFAKKVAGFATGYTTARALGKGAWNVGKKVTTDKVKNTLDQMPFGGQFWKRTKLKYDRAMTYTPLLNRIPFLGKHGEVYNEKMMKRETDAGEKARFAALKNISGERAPLLYGIQQTLANQIFYKRAGWLANRAGIGSYLGIEHWEEKGGTGLKAATAVRDRYERLEGEAKKRSESNKSFRESRNKRDSAKDAATLYLKIQNDHFDQWAQEKNLYDDSTLENGLGDYLTANSGVIADKAKSLKRPEEKWEEMSDGRKAKLINKATEEVTWEYKRDKLKDRNLQDGRGVFDAFVDERGDRVESDLADIKLGKTNTTRSTAPLAKALTWLSGRALPTSERNLGVRNAAHALFQGEFADVAKEEAEQAQSEGKAVAYGSVRAQKMKLADKKAKAMEAKKAGDDEVDALVAKATQGNWEAAQDRLDEARNQEKSGANLKAVKELAGRDKLVNALLQEQNKETAEGKAKEARSLAEKALGQTDIGKDLLEQLAKAEVGQKIGEDFAKTIKDATVKAEFDEAKIKLRDAEASGPFGIRDLLAGNSTADRFAQALYYEKESETTGKEAESSKDLAKLALDKTKVGKDLLERQVTAEIGTETLQSFEKSIKSAKTKEQYDEAKRKLDTVKELEATDPGLARWLLAQIKEGNRPEDLFAQSLYYASEAEAKESQSQEAKSDANKSLAETADGKKFLEDIAVAEVGKKIGEDFIKSIKDEKVKINFTRARDELQQAEEDPDKLNSILAASDPVSRFAQALYYEKKSETTGKEAESAKDSAKLALGKTKEGKEFLQRQAKAEIDSEVLQSFEKSIKSDETKKQYDDATERWDEVKRLEATDRQAEADDLRNTILKGTSPRDRFAQALYYASDAEAKETRSQEAKSLAEKALGTTSAGKKFLEEITEAGVGKSLAEDFKKGIKEARMDAMWEEGKKKLSQIQIKADMDTLLASTNKDDVFAQAIHYSELADATAAEAKASRDKATQAHADAESALYSGDPDSTIRNRLAASGIVSSAVANHLSILTGNDTRYKDAAAELKKRREKIEALKSGGVYTYKDDKGKDIIEDYSGLSEVERNDQVAVEQKNRDAYLEKDEYAMDIYYAQQKVEDDAREKAYKSWLREEFVGTEAGEESLREEVRAELTDKADNAAKLLKSEQMGEQYEEAKRSLLEAIKNKMPLDQIVESNPLISTALLAKKGEDAELIQKMQKALFITETGAHLYDLGVRGFSSTSNANAIFEEAKKRELDAMGEIERGRKGSDQTLFLAGKNSKNQMASLIERYYAISTYESGQHNANVDDMFSSNASKMNAWEKYLQHDGNRNAMVEDGMDPDGVDFIIKNKDKFKQHYRNQLRFGWGAKLMNPTTGDVEWIDRADDEHTGTYEVYMNTGGDLEFTETVDDIARLQDEMGLEFDYEKAVEQYFNSDNNEERLTHWGSNATIKSADDLQNRYLEYQDVFRTHSEKRKERSKQTGHTTTGFNLIEDSDARGNIVRLLSKKEQEKMRSGTLNKDPATKAMPQSFGWYLNGWAMQMRNDVNRIVNHPIVSANTAIEFKNKSDERVRRVTILGGTRDGDFTYNEKGYFQMGESKELLEARGFGDEEVGAFQVLVDVLMPWLAAGNKLAQATAKESNQDRTKAERGLAKMGLVTTDELNSEGTSEFSGKALKYIANHREGVLGKIRNSIEDNSKDFYERQIHEERLANYGVEADRKGLFERLKERLTTGVDEVSGESVNEAQRAIIKKTMIYLHEQGLEGEDSAHLREMKEIAEKTEKSFREIEGKVSTKPDRNSPPENPPMTPEEEADASRS